MPQKTTKHKPRKDAWFRPLRGSYIPANWKGWLTYIPFSAYLIYSLVVGVHYTNNGFKTVLWVVPNWVAATVAMTWIARVTS